MNHPFFCQGLQLVPVCPPHSCHGVTGIGLCWRCCYHEVLQLQMGLLLGLPSRSLQWTLLSVSSVVWEKLPCAVRGPGKRLHGSGGEPNQLEERWGCFLQPVASSPPRCLKFSHVLLKQGTKMHLFLMLCCNFGGYLQSNGKQIE